MNLTNNQIYMQANLLVDQFKETTHELPVKVNFYLIKNKNILISLAQEIEEQRLQILQEYAIPQIENQQYSIPEDKIDIVNAQLRELFSLSQEVQIYKIKLSDFNSNNTLTLQQMEALMFMIEEE